ncbi:uncharacterized protein LOC100179646 [Ciona intestinalis]
MHSFLYALIIYQLLINFASSDYILGCNSACGGEIMQDGNATCTSTYINSMPWSNHEQTAPKANFKSSNWFVYQKSDDSFAIGLNVTWSQNAQVFWNHVHGYVLSVTYNSYYGSKKWLVNATLSTSEIQENEDVVFNFQCFNEESSSMKVKKNRIYFFSLYAMPVYEEKNSMLRSETMIEVPDCSNIEIDKTTECMENNEETNMFDDLFLSFDTNFDDTTDINFSETVVPEIKKSNSLFLLLILHLALVGIALMIALIVYLKRKQGKTVQGTVVILCSRDSHYGEVTSRLATWLKEYMNRDVECNMWRQTDNNILDWCNKQLKEASQVILVCGEKDYEEQMVHSDPFVIGLRAGRRSLLQAKFYCVGFNEDILSKLATKNMKQYLLMKDFKQFYKTFASKYSTKYSAVQKELAGMIMNNKVWEENLFQNPEFCETNEMLLNDKIDKSDRDSGFSSSFI